MWSDDAGRTLTIKWYKCCFTERIYLSWNLSGFVWSSRNIQKSKDTSRTECFLLKGHRGTQTNTPPRPNINKLFCDRSSYFDLWLLLIILWTLRSKSMLYATQGSCPDRTQPYIPHTDRGLWVQPGTCGISLSNKHTSTHTHTDSTFLQSSLQGFWLVYNLSIIWPFLDPQGKAGRSVEQRCRK